MSSKNDETSGMAVALGMIAAGVIFLAMFVLAIAAFISLFFTIVSLWAWNKPRTLWGGNIVEPREAHIFVYSGLIGMVLLPVFAGFCTILFNYDIADEIWTYLAIAGYSAGSLGVTYLAEKEAEASRAAQAVLPAIPTAPARSDQQTIVPPQRPFEFAAWDNEDIQK